MSSNNLDQAGQIVENFSLMKLTCPGTMIGTDASSSIAWIESANRKPIKRKSPPPLLKKDRGEDFVFFYERREIVEEGGFLNRTFESCGHKQAAQCFENEEEKSREFTKNSLFCYGRLINIDTSSTLITTNG